MAKLQQEQLLFQALLRKAQESTAMGRASEALNIYQSILKKKPDNVQALNLCGQLCVSLGRADEARRSLERASRLQPTNPNTWFYLSMAYRMMSQYSKGLEAIEKALRLRPSDPQYVASKAEMLISAGQFDQAESILTPLLSSQAQNPLVLGVYGRLCSRQGKPKSAIDLIEACLQSAMHPAQVRAMLGYILAELYDRSGQYDKAMDAAHLANNAKGARFDPVAFEGVIDAIIAAWTRPYIATIPRPDISSDRTVILIGMPRSGLRVAEQLLGAHPDVYIAGEQPLLGQMVREFTTQAPAGLPVITNLRPINAQVTNLHATTYLNAMKSLSPNARRVVDRQPLSFTSLGYFNVLFPGARVIHVTRDPLDTCLSCYLQSFSGFLPYANNLNYIGHFYGQYRRLMDHWNRVLDVSMLEVSYESMVTDTEAQVRRMLDFIDLPFNAACLKSHEARRHAHAVGSELLLRPISAERVNHHRHYDKHLEPLRMALTPPQPAAV